uniref:Crossover junction endonuclease MUS81 n=1 Tax=Mesocestoides corti TaxID=53468 RepID=A0A5K3FE98_MESCO
MPIVRPTVESFNPQSPLKPPAHPPVLVDLTNHASLDAPSTQDDTPSTHFPGGSYTITLLVDVRETFGMNRLKDLLNAHAVSWEARSLPVGDFAWIARSAEGPTSAEEVVLGVIVERKRADDLASSIVDGRFMEQKGRMHKLGFRKIYLFEECGSMYNLRISYETLLQAMVNAQLIDGFDFINCSNGEQSVAYLASLTRWLHAKSRFDCAVYSDGRRPLSPTAGCNRLWGIPWTQFAAIGKKSPVLPLREQFGLHLLQIHSITGPKAEEIVNAFPTPKSIFEAYDSLSSENDKKAMLMKHKKSAGLKTMTQRTSEMIYYVYNLV